MAGALRVAAHPTIRHRELRGVWDGVRWVGSAWVATDPPWDGRPLNVTFCATCACPEGRRHAIQSIPP